MIAPSDQTITELQLAIEFEPNNRGPYISLANIVLDENRKRDALELLTKVEELAPEEPQLLKAQRRADEYTVHGVKP